MKKFLAIVLIAVMMMAMGTVAFAEGGTITVEGAATGETYTAYKIFDASINATDTSKVSYTISKSSPVWSVVVGSATAENGVYTANGLTFTPTASDPTVFTVAATDTFNVVTFAKLLGDNKASLGTGITGSGAKITVTEDGYYFVDTTLGALCSLYTNNTDQVLYEKNSIPTLTKEVQEDSSEAWGASAQGDMGQTMNFRLTVNTGTNSNADQSATPYNGVDADYVITDTLPAGMTYMDNAAIEGWTKGTDFTAAVSGDVLTITLKASKVSTLGQNADIVITYGARIDTDAVVAGDGNVNTAKLAYQQQETEEVTATVYTYKFEILKVDAADDTPLAGVKFTLKNSEGKYFVASASNSSVWQDAENKLTTDSEGKIVCTGLDADTYTLTEVETLDGYNLLTDPVTVTIAADGTVSATGAGSVADGVITIENETGTILPSTGGIGTTIFYIVGSILVLGAAVILITRRRMNHE